MRGWTAIWGVGWVCAACSVAPRPEIFPPDPSSDPVIGDDPFGNGTDGGPDPTTLVPHPDYGNTVTLADPPPPVSGGTLAVSADGTLAVAADPDRDAVYVVDLVSFAVSNVALQPHDEPGRVVLDGTGHAHMALRRSGDLATIDLQSLAVTRRHACGAPRGLVWESATDRVHVACATGELVSFDAGGNVVRNVFVQRDLRDVVLVGSTLVVSRFKTAELLWLSADGTQITKRVTPKAVNGVTPSAAWRTILSPAGDILMIHQRSNGIISSQGPVYYGSDQNLVTTFSAADGTVKSSAFAPGPLAVDVATAPQPATAPKNAPPYRLLVPLFANAHTDQLDSWVVDPHPTGGGGPLPPPAPYTLGVHYQFTAVGSTKDRLILQSREPARLVLLDLDSAVKKDLELSAVSREDTGHAIFHANAGINVACGSCHLEGGEDGRVWEIDKARRRTPSLKGTIAGTAPYHWEGDMASIDALLADVYAVRMNGGPLKPAQSTAATSWIASIPAPAPVTVDANSATRGQAIFKGSGGCTACHSGDLRTDNVEHLVGNTIALQTPSLIGVGWRAPFLHDGCAATLRDRFSTSCRSNAHGNTASLAEADLGDLVSYLDSL